MDTNIDVLVFRDAFQDPVFQRQGGGVFYHTDILINCQTAKLNRGKGFRRKDINPVFQFFSLPPRPLLPNRILENSFFLAKEGGKNAS